MESDYEIWDKGLEVMNLRIVTQESPNVSEYNHEERQLE